MPHWPSRVEYSTNKVLNLLAEHDTRATFFVVGEVARDHPGLIRDIARAGHEIASHSYRHESVFNQTPEAFRRDVRRTKAELEDLTGREVIGYRAPNFSIGKSEQWAYDILFEEGYRYDSSLFPILHDRYGDRKAPRAPFSACKNGKGELIEFPIGTIRLLGTTLPIGGGGYFRLLPMRIFEKGIKHVNENEDLPVMFYFHPWELDPEQPRPGMSLHHRFRHYVGMRKQEKKLSRLFEAVRFTTAREVLGLVEEDGVVLDRQLSVVSGQ